MPAAAMAISEPATFLGATFPVDEAELEPVVLPLEGVGSARTSVEVAATTVVWPSVVMVFEPVDVTVRNRVSDCRSIKT